MTFEDNQLASSRPETPQSNKLSTQQRKQNNSCSDDVIESRTVCVPVLQQHQPDQQQLKEQQSDIPAQSLNHMSEEHSLDAAGMLEATESLSVPCLNQIQEY